MNNVVKFYKKDAAADPNNVLEQAMDVYETIFIIGWDKNGDMDSRASTNLTNEQLLWLIERFKFNLLSGKYSEDV